jgi:thioredoxin-related protein
MPNTRIAALFLYLMCSSAVANNNVYEYEEEHKESTLIKSLISFKKEALRARDKNIPILIEFSTPWCSYCEALEQEILEPLIMSEEFKDKIIIRKIEVADYSNIVGFDGNSYSSYDISQKYNVSLYPTLVFLNANGKEISQRITGITTISYVAETLGTAISDAISTTNQNSY